VNRIIRPFALSASLFLAVSACATFHPGNGPMRDFEFLEGTWVQITSKEITEEVWNSNKGWSMTGVGRTLRDGREVFGEQLAIEPRGESFVYVALLPGAAPVEFKLVDRGATWARFENPEHDFPQRIEYRRDGNSMRATVSGVEKGVEQREVIEYQRVKG